MISNAHTAYSVPTSGCSAPMSGFIKRAQFPPDAATVLAAVQSNPTIYSKRGFAMTQWFKRIYPGIAASVIATSAWSADGLLDLPLERLMQLEVVGASGFAQTLTEAPSAVSVITAEDIRRFGYRNLGEALQSARGVYATDGRDYSYIGMRGFSRPGDYNTRLLLLSDGIRRNDPLYDTAPIGHDAPIDIDWVKQLEFVPGPASALYGANAIFGVANAVLWSGADLDGSRVAAEVGSGNMGRVSLLSGRRNAQGSDWVFGVSASQRRGEDIYFREFDAPGVGNGVAHGLDGERYLKAFAKLSTEGWKFDAGFSSRRKLVPTAYYGTAFDTAGAAMWRQMTCTPVSSETQTERHSMGEEPIRM